MIYIMVDICIYNDIFFVFVESCGFYRQIQGKKDGMGCSRVDSGY